MASFAGLDILSPEDRKPDKMTFILHGLPGTGKSYAASTIAQLGPTLYIDMLGERGTESFKGTEWEKNITVVRPTSIDQLDDIHAELNRGNHKFEAVVLDSVSAAADLGMQFLLNIGEEAMPEIKRGRAAAQIQHWGQLKALVKGLSVYYANLASSNHPKPIHVVFTSQTAEKPGPDGVDRMYPDLSEGSRNALLAPFDFVGYTQIEANFDTGEMKGRHIVTIGYEPNVCTKRHIAPGFADKVPDVLGRGGEVSLAKLAKALGRA